MIVKCFKAGEPTFSLGDGRLKPHMCGTVATAVVEVGRKYVTALLNGTFYERI